jgi:outer membrane receptor protein involved in Fe transport
MVYNAWKTDVIAAAWHRPSFQSSMGIQYNLKQKIYFNAEMYYISGLQGINLESNRTVKLKNIADLSLKTEYRFSKTFSAFVELNNLLSQKYQRYTYYQVKGFNVLAGLTYSF